MKKLFLWVFCLVILAAGPAWGFELTLLHVNDSHSYLESTRDTLIPGGEKTYVRLGAWSRLATAVNHARRENGNTVLLHAGDAVQGGLYFMKYDGRPEMEFLNRLRFDAYVLGNHEFDRGAEFLSNFLEYAGVPVLAANVDASGVPRLADRLKPYVVRCYQGERVGIIGLTTKDTVFTSSPGTGVSFSDEAETARRYVAELEDMGVNKIVLLTHVGLENDIKLAASVPGVDVIVGGHSHSLLADPVGMAVLGVQVDDNYPVTVKGPDGNDVYVVTAWKWGRVLGKLQVTFDEKGRVTAASGAPVMLVADGFKRKDSSGKKVVLSGEARQQVIDDFAKSKVAAVMAEDAPAATFLEPYTKGVQAMRDDVIGVAPKSLTHIRVPGVTRNGISLPHGSLLAPRVADSMLQKLAGTGEPADIGLVNAGGIRESLSAGKITVGTAYTLMPFNNTLYTLEVTGEQFKAALEYGVTRSGGAFPYVAGSRYAADMRLPEGERVTKVEVENADGQWQPMESAGTYRLVTNGYLARGGDGYAMLKAVEKRYDTGFVDTEAFIEYVKKRKRLLPPKATGVTYIPAK